MGKIIGIDLGTTNSCVAVIGVRNSNPSQTIWKAGGILHKIGVFVTVTTKDYKETSLILTSLQIL